MSGLSWIEIIYWASTIIGGTLFILRAAMMLLGGGLSDGTIDTGLEVDISGDFDTDLAGDHADADITFKLISLQGLTSFFMMFGLVGLALLEANVPVVLTVFGGTIAGLITVGITGLVFSQMRRLQTEGTIDIRTTIGTEGSVYLTIPKNGTGQVQLIAQGSLKIFDAVSNTKNVISTGEKIRVTGVASGNTLIVEKIK